MNQEKSWNANWVAGARRFAISVHGDQRHGDKPYIEHLDDVSRAVIHYGPEYQVLAYLKDVLEDTKVEYEELVERFGPRMADYVVLLTNPPDKIRHNRIKAMFARLGSPDVPDAVVVVKVASRLCHLRDANEHYLGQYIRLYRKEQTEFRSTLYRYRVCDDLWAELEKEIIKER